ncbi:PP2C family protein-serine/threonine phosphatase [Actinoplanes cyaneus]|uniref:PP2C family protein-serine/threonine phosphatase n=1 Tax=Actinoplanes cyaneus TaxID=52696 RepID=UPI001EF16B19|nr:PP2C family serine/threonine-protein phosphatase [Actinoplanes cyaneus]
MREGKLILTECDSCAEGRASGASFCEACGRQLSETAAVGSAGPSTGGDGPLPGDGSAAGEAGATGGTDGTPAPGPESSRRAGRDCPHCGATGAVDTDGYCEQCGLLAGRPRDHTEADGDVAAAAVSDRGRRHHRNEDAMWLAVGVDAADVVVCDGVSSSFDPDVASDVAAKTAGELLARAQHPDSDATRDETTADASTAGDTAADETTASDTTVDVTPETGAGDDADATVPLDGVPQASPEEQGRPAPRAGGGPERTTPPDPALPIAEVVGIAIQGAGQAVAELVTGEDPRRTASNPACTIVAAAVRGPHVGFGWVGDSRAYWVTGSGPAEQLTEDDSWARHVIAMGADPRVAMNDPKAHAITAWLGADAGPIIPHLGAFTARTPGYLVLCSDGLWNYLTDPQDFGEAVRSALGLATGSRPLLEAARALVTYANSAGGADNITVAIVPVHPQTEADAEGDAGTPADEPSEA